MPGHQLEGIIAESAKPVKQQINLNLLLKVSF